MMTCSQSAQFVERVRMLQVHGYTITSKILEGSSTVIYRATQAETGLSVVLTVAKVE